MTADRWILRSIVAITLLTVALGYCLYERSWAEEPGESTKSPVVDSGKFSPEKKRPAASELLAAFRERQKTRSRADKRDPLIAEAKQLGEQVRRVYPYRSLRPRLDYETKASQPTTEARLSPEAASRLQHSDARFELLSGGGPFGDVRAQSLQRLHSDQVAQFIAREGFGVTRMPTPSPSYLELPPAPSLAFAAVPEGSTSWAEDAPAMLPKQVTKYDLARLHAGEPTWTNEDVERKYYDKLRYDEKMKAMAEAFAAWKTKHNPLNLPSRDLILDSHHEAVFNFAGSSRNGHVKDVDHVAGFASHAMTRMPRFEPGPIELQYWPKAGHLNPPRWLVTQLQLVSLLKHELPAVYVSNHLPKMEELEGAKLRPLNDFEGPALQRLIEGESMVIDARANHIRMLGAVRASKQCVQCHQVAHGELLGAFSYELTQADFSKP